MKVGGARSGDRYHISAEINMVPFIDIALVLLIIFMVVSPILVKSQMNVNLPKVTSAAKANETALKIEIDKNGNMSFEGNMVSKGSLRSVMQQKLPEGSKASLLIQADRDVAFNDVVFVMDLAKQLKIEKLGVGVIPETTEP